MASKFGGVPVKASGSRFGGQRVQTEPEADFSGVSSRVIPQPPRTLSQDVGRELGLGGRSVIQGLYNVAGLAFDPLAYAYQSVTGRPQASSSQRGEQLADVLGLPRPETTSERIGGDVTSALTGVGGGIGAARQLAQRAPGVVSRIGQTIAERPGLQAASAVTGATSAGAAREAGVGPTGQAVAGLAGGLAAPVAFPRAGVIPSARVGELPGAPSPLLPPRARLPSDPEQARIVAQAERIGIPIRPAGFDQGKAGQVFRGVPGSGAAKRYESDVAKANDALAEIIGAPRGTRPERVYSEAAARNSAEYDDFARNYSLTLDSGLLKKLTDFRNAAPELGGPPQAARNAVDQFLNEASDIGSANVPGDLFKRLDTELGGVSGARELQTALRSKFKSGMPQEDARRWDELQRRYGDMKTVERLYANLPKTGGVIDPRAVLARINATKRGAARMAKGTRGPLGEFAKIGQAIVPPPKGVMSAASVGLPAAATTAGGLGLGPAGAAGAYGLSNILGRLADRPYTTQSLSRLQALEQAFPGILQGSIQQPQER